VSDLPGLLQWVTQNPLMAAAVLFGGAMVLMALYSYVQDFHRLGQHDDV
jgi:hypothetical protein